MGSQSITMIQLTSRLRYLPLTDEDGAFGLFVVHDNNKVNYTVEVANRDEFVRALDSFRDKFVGVDLT